MLPVPDESQKVFDRKMEEKAISTNLRQDYRKWLRYFGYAPNKTINEQKSPLDF